MIDLEAIRADTERWEAMDDGPVGSFSPRRAFEHIRALLAEVERLRAAEQQRRGWLDDFDPWP